MCRISTISLGGIHTALIQNNQIVRKVNKAIAHRKEVLVEIEKQTIKQNLIGIVEIEDINQDINIKEIKEFCNKGVLMLLVL